MDFYFVYLPSFLLPFMVPMFNKVGSVVVDIIQPNEFVGLIVGAIFLTSF
jgi:hypothetical protein